MVSQTLRSGWLSAALTFFLVVTALAQTEPLAIVTFDPIPDPRAVTYRIQTTVGTLPFATAVECTVPPCTIDGIDGVVTYKVKVAGLEADGKEGKYSVPIDFLFAAIQPLSPTSLSQTSATSTQPGTISKKLSWPAVKKFRPGATFPAGTVVEYRIYQAETSPAVVIATSPTTSFIANGLAKHKSFQFYVTCVVNGIESFTSPAVRVNTN